MSGRRAVQDGRNPHQEPFQTKKAAKHGKMTKHSHFAEIASRQCFCQSVFTQPRPNSDIGCAFVRERRSAIVVNQREDLFGRVYATHDVVPK